MSHRIICGDVLDVLPTLGRFKCLIADPPDNIGLEYDEYDDNLPPAEYRAKLRQWLTAFIKSADIVWFSFNAKHVFDIGTIITQYFYDYESRLFIQGPITFGQNRKTDCGNGYRPLLRLMYPGAKLYPDAIKVPSARQTKYNDKRAAEGGCVPLDFWEFPRVCGTFKQRRKWHKTQLHEGLIERIIKFSTLPGEPICDVFSGTGTVLRAVDNLSPDIELHPADVEILGATTARNPVTSIELSDTYCQRIAAEHGLLWNMAESKRWETYGPGVVQKAAA